MEETVLLGELLKADNVIEHLNNLSDGRLLACLPASVENWLAQSASHIAKQRSGLLVTDSDGTAYLTVEGWSSTQVPAIVSRLKREERLLPGRAVKGELPQQDARSYRLAEPMAQVWQDLGRHGVTIAVVSGRNPTDLSKMYSGASANVVLLPSKGRARSRDRSSAFELTACLRHITEGDPLGVFAGGITKAIRDMLPETNSYLLNHEVISESLEFERITGYRVSVQRVEGRVVLVRLHHRYRACHFVLRSSHPPSPDVVADITNPAKLDPLRMSQWLKTEDGAEVLETLRREDEHILQGLQAVEHRLQIERTDCVGHRSLCQDFAPLIDQTVLLKELVELYGQPWIYAGDNYKPGGNDRPWMEALCQINPSGMNAAITNHPSHIKDDRREEHVGMVYLTQFQLFLLQYLLSRRLSSMQSFPSTSSSDQLTTHRQHD